MRQYKELVNTVLNDGIWKENRTGISTLSYPIAHFRHDMSEGFPLLTTRKMGLKNVAVEVEGYIKGITSKRWFAERGNHYWDFWANPIEVEKKINEFNEQVEPVGTKQAYDILRKSIQKCEDDLGPFYSWQLRRFGQVYSEDCGGIVEQYDQLKDILHTLHSNPNDRRMVAIYWCPFQLKFQSLPPCICLWNINVLDGEIHLSWHQRSADLMIGVPADIAHHALLLLLLCKETGYKPGILGAQFHDLHIYKNHIDNARILVDRDPLPLPTVEVTFPNGTYSMLDWDYKHVSISNYNSHNKLEFDIAI